MASPFANEHCCVKHCCGRTEVCFDKEFLNSLLPIIAKCGFPIRESALLYQALLGVCEENSIVNSVCVDYWTAE